MKQTIYIAVWQAIKLKDCEWSKIYERLVPIKCSYDERKRAYIGKGKIIGRIAGQMISVIYTLLKKDQETLSNLKPAVKPPEPVLYDPDVHHKHRSGQYHAPVSRKEPKLIQMPSH